jgi:hypothetical protein
VTQIPESFVNDILVSILRSSLPGFPTHTTHHTTHTRTHTHTHPFLLAPAAFTAYKILSQWKRKQFSSHYQHVKQAFVYTTSKFSNFKEMYFPRVLVYEDFKS